MRIKVFYTPISSTKSQPHSLLLFQDNHIDYSLYNIINKRYTTDITYCSHTWVVLPILNLFYLFIDIFFIVFFAKNSSNGGGQQLRNTNRMRGKIFPHFIFILLVSNLNLQSEMACTNWKHFNGIFIFHVELKGIFLLQTKLQFFACMCNFGMSDKIYENIIPVHLKNNKNWI